MHDHETCEQLMAAAARTNHPGRLEFLAARCDKAHGELTTSTELEPTAEQTHAPTDARDNTTKEQAHG